MKTHRFHNSLRVCVCVNKTFFFSKINTYRSLYSITFLFWPYSHTSHKHNNKWVYITKFNKRNFHAFNRFVRNQIQKDECAKDILRETQQKKIDKLYKRTSNLLVFLWTNHDNATILVLARIRMINTLSLYEIC